MTAVPPAPHSAALRPRIGFPPDQTAILLDFDGTLVDIAPTPESVVVPPGLRETLLTLRERCGGALAVVTGRPIEQIDHFLPGVPTAVCGEHGIAIRRHPGAPIERAPLPEVPQAWRDEAEKIVRGWPGASVEPKRAGFVLHYRGAPDAQEPLREAAEGWLAGDDSFEIQAAKMAWEIRPSGVDKGHAVEALLEQAPFAGRKPLFVGDDVTDNDGIRAARAAGGVGFRIPDDFPTAQAFRDWLKHYSEAPQWDV
ncbi:trehalose phosphatase [Neoasaia chiangmaiensis NBRC 101099]|uniref:Trehalose 6-phosphate phosphatase n=1 Tax=Neoasaia chiangmaiensis TaxID=320497 RepID=A0A1U9KR86_9PROT|nr:trehalose-phosphatase [Neoasaia chiangmaiensis]AQS88323.1 trehalose-phosphatase [Neoasaia chiangmaiensis]GBR39539.1 trehalose phosphatase [Neoasaia chiangmaiensis NBRC 101099]GEN14629.1 trehalose 6-phosphate phosphatase [Neoasaia chiangmaiensis]